MATEFGSATATFPSNQPLGRFIGSRWARGARVLAKHLALNPFWSGAIFLLVARQIA
jgi:hypothetical protein